MARAKSSWVGSAFSINRPSCFPSGVRLATCGGLGSLGGSAARAGAALQGREAAGELRADAVVVRVCVQTPELVRVLNEIVELALAGAVLRVSKLSGPHRGVARAP